MVRKLASALILTATPLLAVPMVTAYAMMQDAPALPGIADPARVTAGTYAVDPAHTLIGFTVDHLGFNPYFGIFGDSNGTLIIDPANPSAARVDITIPVFKLTTASSDLTKHLQSDDFFGTAAHPVARFISTAVRVDGTTAEIDGNLTVKGVTRPVTLNAQFTGAGKNPMSKAETIGFTAKTTIKRSDFGVNYGIPMVSDEVALNITAAFEKAPSAK